MGMREEEGEKGQEKRKKGKTYYTTLLLRKNGKNLYEFHGNYFYVTSEP